MIETLKDIIFRYGEEISRGDYSFLEILSKTEFNVMLKALIKAEVSPFDEVPDTIRLNELLLDLYLGIHHNQLPVFLPSYSHAGYDMTQEEQIALAKMIKKLGAKIYKTNRHEGIYKTNPLMLYTFGNLHDQIVSNELDNWAKFLQDGKGPYKYEDFTEVDIL